MEKTELMLKYEQETGKKSERYIMVHVSVDGYDYGELVHDEEYVSWLLSKAEAYDRLMSGKGRMTLKELANFKGFPITIDSDWTINSHGAEPKMVEMPHGAGFWVNEADDEEEIDESFVEIPDDFDWKTSLTLPDGWEEK